jgi:DNA-binding XRE family transcriptional regulator
MKWGIGLPLSLFDRNNHNRCKGLDQAVFDRLVVFNQTWHSPLMTPAQCRAARGLLSWTQDDLARAAAVGIVTVRQFEADKGSPRRSTLSVIQQAFESAGVEFIPENGGGAGVRVRESRGDSK